MCVKIRRRTEPAMCWGQRLGGEDVDRSGAAHEAVSEAASAASHAVGQGDGSTRKRLDSERRLSDVLIVVSRDV